MAREILNNNKIRVGGLNISFQFGFVDISRIIMHKIDTKMKIGLISADANGFQQIVQTTRDYSNDYKIHGFYGACVFGQYSVIKMLLENSINHQFIVQEFLANIIHSEYETTME
jgi:hypothetical protein